MEAKEGVLEFDYKGRRLKIPYSTVPWGGDNKLHLIDKHGCTVVVYLEGGKWVPLWHERFSSEFKETLDWVIKQELGNK